MIFALVEEVKEYTNASIFYKPFSMKVLEKKVKECLLFV